MGLFSRRRAASDGELAEKTASAGQHDASSSSGTAESTAEPPLKPVRFYQLFRYADATDKSYIFLGCVSAIVHGVFLPLFTIFLGDVINSFGGGGDTVLRDELRGASIKLFAIGGGALVTSFFQVYCLMRSAQRQGNRIRVAFVKSILSQDMAWYDSINPGELTTRVAGDVDLLQAGIGDKVGSVLQFGSMFVSGFVVGFVYGWKMTLVILAVTPVLAIGGGLMAKVSSEATSEGQGHYAKAGAVATEVIGMIRIVTAFGGQNVEAARYKANLQAAYKDGVKRANIAGIAMGFTFLVIFCVYGLAFYYGSLLVRRGEMEPGYVITVFFSVIIGAMSLGQGAPAFQSFTTARGAAPKVFEIIERDSKIDPFSGQGLVPFDQAQGDIDFDSVDFTYPSRPEVQILNKMSLQVRRGETLALVGASGCGKSTTVQLLERFYDTDAGTVYLDGKDIREYNVCWLRSQIGFVSQLPTLFAGTIAENIAFGAPMEPTDETHTAWERKQMSQEQIEHAAKLANAHQFIIRLPEKYETVIGERGAMLSGGQKQRIAIARALIRDPKILLLDEATSALDAASEKLVQDALENAAEGRTTMVIAHRLSTIQNADKIAVVENGKIVEMGSHQELLGRREGKYAELVTLQNLKAADAGQQNNDVQNKTLEEIHAEADRVIVGDEATASMSLHETSRHRFSDESNSDVTEIEPDKQALSRAFMANIDQWPLMLIGCIGAGISGSSFVLMALVFSEVIGLLVSADADRSEINFWVGMFCLIGVVAFVATYLQQGLLGLTGERLTKKLRGLCFDAVLRQEIGFFDEKENSVGSLTTRLGTEASLVKGLTGETLGIFSSVILTLVAGIIVAFTGCWRVALVVVAMMPAVAVGGFIQIKLMTGFDTEGKKKYAVAGTIASEAVDNIRAVAACGIEYRFVDIYEAELGVPLKEGNKSALVAGIAFGVSEFFTFAVFAVSYWYGGSLVPDTCDFVGVNKALNGLLFGAMTLGNVAAFLPDVAGARVAATKIFKLLDRSSEADPTSAEGSTPTITGDLVFENVKFKYPTRQEVDVLKKLCVSVGPGKTLALVGESGCGKSTMVSIVERFYDVSGGLVSVDGHRIEDINIRHLRSKLSIVLQEPDLFDCSIRDNITYGMVDDRASITDIQIIEVAKKANAHDFITELPGGYDTIVGLRGGRLSGGQRQRIAIARALLRDPKVLLLDEATSALDSRSEGVVQEALDRARVGRTVITIAHRLATIQNSDAIAVVADGKIAEIGTHEELSALNGLYSNLVRHQMMSGQAEA